MTVRALLTGLVDYAGLYPPASLPIPVVAANHAAYSRSAEQWMLGRLIVPAARLGELTNAMRSAPDAAGSWRISAMIANDHDEAADAIAAFNASHPGGAWVDSVEYRAGTATGIEASARAFGAFTRFAEIPLADVRALLPTLEDTGTNAKIRTGGVTLDAIPETALVGQFLVAAAGRVAFKATAGLHHPLRSHHPLTYEQDAPRGTMHGFLNVFVAATFAHAGFSPDTVQRILDEASPEALRFTDDGIGWREDFATLEQVASARRVFALSFGSCSFREPVDDLVHLGLL